MGVDMFLWLMMAAEFHGVSSYTGSIKTTKVSCFGAPKGSECVYDYIKHVLRLIFRSGAA